MNLLQIIAVTILTVASSAQADGESHPQTGQLTNAIVSMQEQEYDKFVIVEIPETDNYFQFDAEGASAYIFVCAHYVSYARTKAKSRGLFCCPRD